MKDKSRYRKAAASPILSLSSTHVSWQGKRLLNFASHDYLGVSQHDDLKKNAIKALLHYGTGLCCKEAQEAYIEYESQVEDRCCQFLGMEELRFFSSRWTALEVILSSLQCEEGSCFVDIHCDPLLQLAAKKWQRVISYDSDNSAELQQLFERESHHSGPKLLLTESLLSLNGKCNDLEILHPLMKKHNIMVLVDHSNAIGIEGNGGLDLRKDIADFFICALDRGLGATGACVASHLKLDFLLRTFPIDSREWSVSFSSLGAIDSAFELISTMEGERKQLQQRCHWLRMQMKRLELPVLSSSHFFCFIFSEKESAETLWQQLLQKEILAELIKSRDRYIVRLIVNANHTTEDLTTLLSFF